MSVKLCPKKNNVNNVCTTCIAERDDLTGVYNMRSFFEHAKTMLKTETDCNRYILCFDISRFRDYNALFGFSEGDNLLKAIRHLVFEQIDRRHDLLGRLYSDIFVAYIEGDEKYIHEFIENISKQIAEYTSTYRVKVFFGICRVDNINIPVHVLCDRSRIALRTVKGNELINYAFFDDTLKNRTEQNVKVRNKMHDALLDKEFLLYLQPKVEISTGKILGAEALARWKQPNDELVSPAVFIPVFEKTGFIIKFDEYIWEETCKMLRIWIDKGYKLMPVSINVSRIHFNDDNFCSILLRLVEKYDLPPHLLELELTESAFFENEKRLIRDMKILQENGFVFSMDDFGTGYSSLNTLRTLPFNIIKLDKAFISDGTDNERGQIVARHTVQMAKELNMKIIAEGVETVNQARFLLHIGCNLAQGYYYSKPVDVEEFEVLSFVQEKAFWVDPILQIEADYLHISHGPSHPQRDV